MYVIFDHLGATDLCGHPGSVMPNATVPLQPSLVSSVGLGDGALAAVNFADLTNCSMNTAGSHTNVFGDKIDPCHPSLQYDISYLSTIQPAWATCVDVGGVLWDPPSALTSVSLVNGFDPPSPVPTATSRSSTNTASPRAHLPPVPPMTDPPTQPSMPKQTSVDPLGQTSLTVHSHETPSDPVDPLGQNSPIVHSHETPSDPAVQPPADPTRKPKRAAEAGQVANIPVRGANNAATESTTPVSQAPSRATANDRDTAIASISGGSQVNVPNKDPIGDPSDPGAPSSPQPLIVGDETITIPNTGAIALKTGPHTLNVQTPVLTLSNTPVSLAPDKIQIGTSAHPFLNPAPTPLGNMSFTLNPQGIAVDGTQIRVGGLAATVHGTRVSLGLSEVVIGDKTETFAPSVSDTPVEINRESGAVGTGVGGAGTAGNTEPSTSPNESISRAVMSSLGATGVGAATPRNGSGPAGNGGAAATFLGAASKVGDGVNLWVGVGSGCWLVGCLMVM